MQKNFVSEIDKFLAAFDQKNPKQSDSQQCERKKYSRIFKLRDDPEAAKKDREKIWEDF